MHTAQNNLSHLLFGQQHSIWLSADGVHMQAGVRESYYGYGDALCLCRSETLSQFPITGFRLVVRTFNFIKRHLCIFPSCSPISKHDQAPKVRSIDLSYPMF